MSVRKILIGGQWRKASDTIEVTSPYSHKTIADVFSADADETSEAIGGLKRKRGPLSDLSRKTGIFLVESFEKLAII